MKVTRNKKETMISFDMNNEVNNSFEHEEENDILAKFLQKCKDFSFPPIHNSEIENFEKMGVAFAVQYGTRNEKTIGIFLKFLEKTKQIATNCLKKKDYLETATHCVTCLGFVDPDDEIFLEKFIVTKVDVVNKLMFCLIEMEKQRNENKYIEEGEKFLEKFLMQMKQYSFYQNLLKSQSCMLELNYFYLGVLYKKRKKISLAREMLIRVHDIIKEKYKNKIYGKTKQLEKLQKFAMSLQIKTEYIISECYRDTDKDEQKIYQQRAKGNAKKYDPALYQYLNKEIRFYEKAQEFKSMLSKMQGKKKIEQNVLKLIDESKNNEICSLYDVYLDAVTPNQSKLNISIDHDPFCI